MHAKKADLGSGESATPEEKAEVIQELRLEYKQNKALHSSISLEESPPQALHGPPPW